MSKCGYCAKDAVAEIQNEKGFLEDVCNDHYIDVSLEDIDVFVTKIYDNSWTP
jgi:copper chaperone CopZ